MNGRLEAYQGPRRIPDRAGSRVVPQPGDPRVLAWALDVITVYYLGQVLFPLLGITLSALGLRLALFLLPMWPVLAMISVPLSQLKACLLRSRGVLVGLCGYSLWIFGEWVFMRSAAAERDFYWVVWEAIPLYVMGCYYGYLRPERFWRILTMLLALLGVQAAYSLPTLIAGTYYPKLIQHDLMAGAEYVNEAARHGVFGYFHYQNTAIISCVVLGMALSLNQSKLRRWFWLLAWTSLVQANGASTYTASMLISVIGTWFILGIAVYFHKKSLFWLLPAALAAGIAAAPIVASLTTSEVFNHMIDKAHRIFTSTLEGGLQEEESLRGQLFLESLAAFGNSPIVGHGAQGAATAARWVGGGHSEWLNRLVDYGLLGSGWLFIMLFGVGREVLRARRMRKGDALASSLVVAYACYLLYGFVDPIPQTVVFFFVIFGSALALQCRSPKSRVHDQLYVAEGMVMQP